MVHRCVSVVGQLDAHPLVRYPDIVQVVLALLVLEVLTIVLVMLGTPVITIELKGHRRQRLVRHVVHRWPPWQQRVGPDVERQLIQRRVRDDVLVTGHFLTVPEVDPVAGRR